MEQGRVTVSDVWKNKIWKIWRLSVNRKASKVTGKDSNLNEWFWDFQTGQLILCENIFLRQLNDTAGHLAGLDMICFAPW